MKSMINLEDFMGSVRVTEACWYWTAARDKDGYGLVWWKGKKERSHRVSYSLFKGAIPRGDFVCHSCDTPACVNPNHLWIGNAAANMWDMENKQRGNHPSGERHYRSKFTLNEIKKIRAMYRLGFKQKDIGKRFGVSQSHISHIVNEDIWKEAE